MPSVLSSWRALSRAERRQLSMLAIALPAVELSLRVVGARRTAMWLRRATGERAPHAATPDEWRKAERLAQLASVAGRRGPLSAHCLPQALLVQAWLRARGLHAALKLGVDKQDARFDAHAWVELDGRPLTPRNPAQRPLPDLPWG